VLVAARGATFLKDAMPILDVGGRLNSSRGRLDLAADVIGVTLHPTNEAARMRRRSALAETNLGMSDPDDEPEARAQVESWFRQSGGFKTASQSDPYDKQQSAFVRNFPHIVFVGATLNLVWSMDCHHRDQLVGGASISKAISIMVEYPGWMPRLSKRSLWASWTRYKSVPHLCVAFTLALYEAFQAPPGERDERFKIAYDQRLDITLSLAAAYQRFGVGFKPHGNARPLLDPRKIWRIRGVEADDAFTPPPLPPEVLAAAEKHQAPPNNAYR
jgi:hypothetical protein